MILSVYQKIYNTANREIKGTKDIFVIFTARALITASVYQVSIFTLDMLGKILASTLIKVGQSSLANKIILPILLTNRWLVVAITIFVPTLSMIIKIIAKSPINKIEDDIIENSENKNKRNPVKKFNKIKVDILEEDISPLFHAVLEKEQTAPYDSFITALETEKLVENWKSNSQDSLDEQRGRLLNEKNPKLINGILADAKIMSTLFSYKHEGAEVFFKNFIKFNDIDSLNYKNLSIGLYNAIVSDESKNNEEKRKIIITLLQKIKNPILFLNTYFENCNDTVGCGFGKFENFQSCFKPLDRLLNEIHPSLSISDNLHLLLHISGRSLSSISFDTEKEAIIAKLLENADDKAIVKCLQAFITNSKNSSDETLETLGRRAKRLFKISSYIASLNLSISEKLDQLEQSHKENIEIEKLKNNLDEIFSSSNDLKTLITECLMHMGRYSSDFQSTILLPKVESSIKEFFNKEATSENFLKNSLSMRIQWFTRSLISHLPNLVQSWQSDILKNAEANDCLAWFEKLQRFHLYERSDNHRDLIVNFVENLNSTQMHSILDAMSSSTDQLILSHSSSSTLHQQIYKLLKEKIENAEKPRLRDLMRFKNFLKNLTKDEKRENHEALKKEQKNVEEKIKTLLKNNKTYLDPIIKDIKDELEEAKKTNNETDLLVLVSTRDFFKRKRLEFFEGKNVLLPQYYHSTKWSGINKILEEKVIKVAYKSFNKGAWTSTKRESYYGDYCIAMYTNINTYQYIKPTGLKNEDGHYWIGFQDNIELINRNKPMVSHISVPRNNLDAIESVTKRFGVAFEIIPEDVSDKIQELTTKHIEPSIVAY